MVMKNVQLIFSHKRISMSLGKVIFSMASLRTRLEGSSDAEDLGLLAWASMDIM